VSQEAGGAPVAVAFGAFPPWEGPIRQGLEARYRPHFVEPAEARLDDFDAVVPLQTAHYDALALRPDLRGRKFLHPSPEANALCHDKLALTRFLIASGLAGHAPPLRSPGPPYPYIWKRRHGGWGRQAHVIRGPEDEQRLDLADADWFAQDAVAGDTEYASHVMRAGGRVRYAMTVTYALASPLVIMGQHSLGRVTTAVRGCEPLRLFADILGRIDYEGVACFDYKVVDGRPQIFEINPRFGASLTLDITAFVDAYRAALQPG